MLDVYCELRSRSPTIRDLLGEQPERSARETKRLISIWTYYVRVLIARGQMTGDAAEDRACQLLHLAEIAARWPSLQRHLNRRINGRTGVALLIAAADNGRDWADVRRRLGIDAPEHERACRNLRTLIRKYDLRPAAELSHWIR